MKDRIEFLVLWVGTTCTLKCRNCCNFIPHLNQTLYECDVIENNIRYITENVNIELLQIQGGEPFTHHDISRIINVCASLKNVRKIEIASNGTLTPDAETMSLLRRHSDRVTVRISNYDCVSKDYRDSLVGKMREGGASVEMYDFRDGDGSWIDFGEIDRKMEIDSDRVAKIYQSCRNRYCWVLAKDLFATCGRMISLLELKGIIDLKNNNIINVTKMREMGVDFRKVLTDFDCCYRGDTPALCGFCSDEHNKIKAALQMV